MLLPLVLLSLASLGSAYRALSDASLKLLPGPGSDFDIKTGALLAPILRPRVSGTEGNAAVRQHFIDFFQTNLPAWHIELHNSSFTTPVSNGNHVPFVNLIATRDPPGTLPGDVSRLTLVAHYDSKLTPDGFIGAIDSAAPCAMLLHVARTLDVALARKWAAGGDNLDVEHKGLQILLLDGEEAFETWTATDSIYGARALAEDWESTTFAPGSTFRNPLDAIDLFVLLDLLGSPGPTVPSYFASTHWAYQHMAGVEARLRALGELKSSPNHAGKRGTGTGTGTRREPVFLHEATKQDSADAFLGGYVLDDHVPFLMRGVDVLHVIPSPFPRVWHEVEDDGEHLDGETVEDWARIVAGFAAGWMEVEEFLGEVEKESGVGSRDEL